LGKAYSFPGLQKYLKVNYDPARDNQLLAEIVQSMRQHSQSSQQAEEPVIQELEIHSPLPSPLPVEDQPPREQKIQPVWSPQYGIPDIQDLIRAIPEHSKESLTGSAEREHRQLEHAQATYQQWALQAQKVYRVVEPQDIDQRIAFLMQKQQQSPKQITQVLAQSPAVQELLRRSPTYAQSYSEFCQSQALYNQAVWQAELDQYHRAVEIEHQQQEQRRIALELKQQQQRERQHNLKLLLQWQEAASALGRPVSYVERIKEVTASYQRGLPLSEKTIEARQKDLAEYQQQMQRQQQERGRGFSR
jgi:hypothetical protein